jgi:hypothetical protein
MKISTYIRSISFKVSFKKKTYYMNDAIICRQTILNQLDIMVSYVDINGLCNSVAIL